jgi:phage pi2 protein 07
MKTKEELVTAVNNLPEFEYRNIGLKMLGPEEGTFVYEDVPKNWVAITEVGSCNPVTFASNRYRLLQFKDSFLPLVESHEDVEGTLKYHHGFGILDLFPNDPNLIIDSPRAGIIDKYKIGISAYNSVNRTSALIIRFSLTDGNRIITFPKDVSSFYQAHKGEIKTKTDNYVELINKIKEFWPTVLKDMVETEVTAELFDQLTKEFKCDPNIKKKLKLEIEGGVEYNMWSLILEIYDKMADRQSKSDVHLRKRRDEFINSVSGWATVMKVFG